MFKPEVDIPNVFGLRTLFRQRLNPEAHNIGIPNVVIKLTNCWRKC